MDTALDKFSLNTFASFIISGAIFLLFILWGLILLFPHQPNHFKGTEALGVFSFLTVSYLTGLLISRGGSVAENVYYKIRKIDPRLYALKNSYHWLEDLDTLYTKMIKVSIYDTDKTGIPKKGEINGKKVDKYNLSKFDHFALFYLLQSNLNGPVENEKQKYLLYRNLSVSLILCVMLTVVYLFVFKGQLSCKATDMLYNTNFINSMCVVLLIIASLLFRHSLKQRITYLETLYRTVRYRFLAEVNK